MKPHEIQAKLNAISRLLNTSSSDDDHATMLGRLSADLGRLKDRIDSTLQAGSGAEPVPDAPGVGPPGPTPGPLLDLTLRVSRVAVSGTRESPWMDVGLERWPSDLAAVVQQVRLELHGTLDFAYGRDYRVTIAPAPDDDGAG